MPTRQSNTSSSQFKSTISARQRVNVHCVFASGLAQPSEQTRPHSSLTPEPDSTTNFRMTGNFSSSAVLVAVALCLLSAHGAAAPLIKNADDGNEQVSQLSVKQVASLRDRFNALYTSFSFVGVLGQSLLADINNLAFRIQTYERPQDIYNAVQKAISDGALWLQTNTENGYLTDAGRRVMHDLLSNFVSMMDNLDRARDAANIGAPAAQNAFEEAYIDAEEFLGQDLAQPEI